MDGKFLKNVLKEGGGYSQKEFEKASYRTDVEDDILSSGCAGRRFLMPSFFPETYRKRRELYV